MSATLPDPASLTGAQRYARTAEQLLGVTLTAEQRTVLEALAEHDRVHVMSGNGVGKSFVAAVICGTLNSARPMSAIVGATTTGEMNRRRRPSSPK